MKTEKLNIKWIILVALGVFFIFVRWVLDFEGVYGQDSYEYLRYSEALTNSMQTGADRGPFFWPVFYPLLGSFLAFIFDGTLALQLISLLSFYGVLLLLHQLIKNQGLYTGLYIFLALGLSPYFLRGSVLCMSDMLATFLVLLSFYSLEKIKSTQNGWWFLALCLFASLGVMTRYPVAILVLFIGLDALVFMLRKKLWSFRIILLSTLLLFTPLLLTLLPEAHQQDSFLGHDFLDRWSFSNFFNADQVGAEGVQHNWVPNMLYIFSPIGHAGYLLMGSVLIGFQLRKRKRMINYGLFSLGIIIYLLFLGGIAMQNQRFFMIVFPLIVYSLYPAFSELMTQLKKVKKIIFIIGLIILQTGLFVYSSYKFLSMHWSEKELAKFVQENYPTTTIYTLEAEPALNHYEAGGKKYNLFVETYSNFHPGDLFILYPQSIETRWKDEAAGKTWANVQKNHTLKTVHQFNSGLVIYEVQ